MRINPIAQAFLVFVGIALYCISLSGGFGDMGFRPAGDILLLAQNKYHLQRRLPGPLATRGALGKTARAVTASQHVPPFLPR